MIPESSVVSKADEAWKNTKTYNIDFKNKKIVGKIDGKEAMAQAIYKILNTARYEFEIYNWNYGCEVNNILGENRKDVEMLAEKYIEEAVMADKRIKGIRDFEAIRDKNILKIYFVAECLEEDIEIESEVNM